MPLPAAGGAQQIARLSPPQARSAGLSPPGAPHASGRPRWSSARLSQPLAPLDAHLPQRRKRIVVRTSPPRWWPATRTVLRASPPQEEAD